MSRGTSAVRQRRGANQSLKETPSKCRGGHGTRGRARAQATPARRANQADGPAHVTRNEVAAKWQTRGRLTLPPSPARPPLKPRRPSGFDSSLTLIDFMNHLQLLKPGMVNLA
ncbi:hypothetical protein EVAR_51529_1 [Eumeta japonica]|uniref:Uncharacterized protein n=1 Tax=Eumeta variegata TaxID=151549 RepID=A0A4C1XAX7_EUMVA|nr:hypothetical protein EVAR_51529_1 [Eumeta japonica]